MDERPPEGDSERDPEESDDRESLWSVGRKWLPWCMGLIFVLTIGWTAFVAWDEAKSGEHDSVAKLARAVVEGSSPAAPLIVIYALLIIATLDTGGSATMATYKFFERKILKPQADKLRAEGEARGRAEGEARGRAEGEAEGEARGEARGRAEERRAWTEWNRRRMEAERKGETFDEPPPGS